MFRSTITVTAPLWTEVPHIFSPASGGWIAGRCCISLEDVGFHARISEGIVLCPH